MVFSFRIWTLALQLSGRAPFNDAKFFACPALVSSVFSLGERIVTTADYNNSTSCLAEKISSVNLMICWLHSRVVKIKVILEYPLCSVTNV